jgi:hypothetical protein
MNSSRPSDRRCVRALLVACVMVLLLSTPVAARPGGSVMVTVDDGSVTLEAIEAAWPDVIRELTRKTGMVLHVSSLPEHAVTASFTRVDAAQMVRRLFGATAGFAFVYGVGPVPAEVWVTSVRTSPFAVPIAYVSALSETGDVDAEVRANEAHRLASEEGDAAVDALARMVLMDPDAGVRSAAARGLLRIGTPRALDAAARAGVDAAKLAAATATAEITE